MTERMTAEGGVGTILLRQYICVFRDGETYTTWESNKEMAIEECELKRGKGTPWRVFATGNCFRVGEHGYPVESEESA